jgi:hypothetical protein
MSTRAVFWFSLFDIFSNGSHKKPKPTFLIFGFVIFIFVFFIFEKCVFGFVILCFDFVFCDFRLAIGFFGDTNFSIDGLFQQVNATWTTLKTPRH